ncbi:U3 small nucleolar RNA-associated protein 10, N-terminal [Dillenia turbinata]|uniref:U3 small nucleolar RNA-associated protein 10, N-terminal n=1 Tax=Dillenia turbinata TaxID=194707 RepID=A0AAN8ZJW0_9MAGN
MATTIASQLQALKAFVKPDSEPLKRPFTRPSILFDPKEAADIDLETIFNIALSGGNYTEISFWEPLIDRITRSLDDGKQGFDVLIGMDERFRNYRNDLFNHNSMETDRELKGIEDNNRINMAIGSYLRLLSPHLQLPSALKTLEYLIRRFKIYIYNVEELILCALPYHDTHVFVRIVQLLEIGNDKWRFLHGVKVSGAPPPRTLIVRQCISDMGVLEALCDYATTTKRFTPSRPVISFCTAVVVEALGSVSTVDTEVVKRILPFVTSGLQAGEKGLDHKAGALMIIGLLASRATLSPKLVKSLTRSIAEVTREDAKESKDLKWIRTSLMALINLVQLQPVDGIPKKALEILIEIRDLPGVLRGLSEEFNIDKFVALFLDSLVDCSYDDENCRLALEITVQTLPLKGIVGRLVSKLLRLCMRLSQRMKESSSLESGTWAKKILAVINKNHPTELQAAVHKFLEDTEVQFRENLAFESFCRVLEGDLDWSQEMPDTKIWFALEHPKAEVRCSTLSNLNAIGLVRAKNANLQTFTSIQDSLLRRLQDNDLGVVQAALSLERLNEVISTYNLLEAFHHVLQRCIKIVMSRACHYDISLSVGSAQVEWPFYANLVTISRLEHLDCKQISIKIIICLAEKFSELPGEYMPWLVECCHHFELSRRLVYLILLESFSMHLENKGTFQCSALFDTCFPVLKTEWKLLESAVNLSAEESASALKFDCQKFLDQLYHGSVNQLNAHILICLFWRLLELYLSAECPDMGEKAKQMQTIEDLFVFFAASSTKHVFLDHIHYLLSKCKISPVGLLSKFLTHEGVSVAVQVESLHCFAFLCSEVQSTEGLFFQLISEFPVILVPLSSEEQDVRIAAMDCVEAMCNRLDISSRKNGAAIFDCNNFIWSYCIEELLGLVVQQKRLILSDRDFLASFLTSLLGTSFHSLLVAERVGKRFSQSMKEELLGLILGFAMKLPAYGKLRILSLFKGMGDNLIHVADVASLLSDLLKRRSDCHVGLGPLGSQLSRIEIDILCLLLECSMVPTRSGHVCDNYLLDALQVDRVSRDPSIIQPCITIVQKLGDSFYSVLKADVQELLFQHLVILCGSPIGDIQIATKEALLRLHISSSTMCQILDLCLGQEGCILGSSRRKKKRSPKHRTTTYAISEDLENNNPLSFLCSLLDILLQKRDMGNRASLVSALFKLFNKIANGEWPCGLDHNEKRGQASSGTSQTVSRMMYHIQQTLLSILDDICASLSTNVSQDGILNEIDIKPLVKCAHTTEDITTRNLIFSLLSTIAKVAPNIIVVHIIDILTAIGKSAVMQYDSHSQNVFEYLISSLVPCLLSEEENINQLLQIFIDVLPEVAEGRRVSLISYLLRSLGERSSLASLLVLLFHSLILRKRLLITDNTVDFFTLFTRGEWEYAFATQICDQFSYITWLPSLVMLLEHLWKDRMSQDFLLDLLLAMHFILHKLQHPELAMGLEIQDDSDCVQRALQTLLERVVSCVCLIDLRRKQIGMPAAMRKELKECMHTVLRTLGRSMIPSAYFKSISKLLTSEDKNVGKKALGLLCDAMKDHGATKVKRSKRESRLDSNNNWSHLNRSDLESFDQMCLDIIQVVDCSSDSDTSLKLSAVSAIEVLVTSFPSNYSIFSKCLASVTKSIGSQDLALSSSCIRTSGALISVLGPRALSELPSIMDHLLKCSHDTRILSASKVRSSDNITSVMRESFLQSILVTLETVIDKLGGFLNPYLGGVIEFLVLHPVVSSGCDLKLKSKAETARRLVTEKIPVRLVLPPLLTIYSEAAKIGESSLVVAFDMLANLVGRMDRSSISAFHAKIFELCLVALDLRQQHPISIENINIVEEKVINAIIVLTMKLTEVMFKPLFIRSIEWAESNVKEDEHVGPMDMGRAISFYHLINKLAENHRSLFVPYFKYLLEGCVRYLTNDKYMKKGALNQKKKKAKIQEANYDKSEGESVLSISKWHLRALILASLHKCFLYDTGNLKFLNSENFQASTVLLKPVVSQLVAEPPASLEEHLDIPSVKEVDDTLVACIGQMAVTAGSDLLWKPLNHEVLLLTRSDKVRPRILGLRIVKSLMEKLKEEYLVLLAETIPFLSELLEDVELPVRSLTQDILKEMESLSGESLRQYL